MNKLYRSIWSEAAGGYVAVSETTKAKGRLGGGGKLVGRTPSHVFSVFGLALAAISSVSMAQVYTSPAADNNTYQNTVSDGASQTIGGVFSVGNAGGPSSGSSQTYTLNNAPAGSYTFTTGPVTPATVNNWYNAQLPSQSGSVTQSDPVTGTSRVVTVYSTSDLNFPILGTNRYFIEYVPGASATSYYVAAGLGNVDSSGGTLKVNIGDNVSPTNSAGNQLTIAAKQTALTYADGTGVAASNIEWDSQNRIDFQVWTPAPSTAIGTFSNNVTQFAGTFTAFDGSTHTVTDPTSLQTYNTWLVTEVQAGALTQAQYNAAITQAIPTTTSIATYNNWTDGAAHPNDAAAVAPSPLNVMRAVGANATATVAASGVIQAVYTSGGVLYGAQGAHLVNNGSISASGGGVVANSADMQIDGTGTTAVNNGVISAGMLLNPDGTSVGGYTTTGQIYGFAASNGAAATNNGIVNAVTSGNYGVGMLLQSGSVGVNNGTINLGDAVGGQINGVGIGAWVQSNSTFTNNAAGTIYVGRAPQATPGVSASDVALASNSSSNSTGILIQNNGNAINYGNIILGTLIQGAAGIRVSGATNFGAINDGDIVIKGGSGVAAPLSSYGILVSDSVTGTGVGAINNGTIEVDGANNVGIGVFANTVSSTVTSTSTGQIIVSGGIDPTSNTRNIGVLAQGTSAAITATANVNSTILLNGTGAIGVLARGYATVNVGASALPQFNNIDQIGFFAYGVGSTINVAAQNLTVGSDDSTLFRVASGAAFTGSSSAGPLTMNINGQNARGIVATDAGTTLSTGNSIYNVNGLNGIAITDQGGASGTINAGTIINLNAAGAIAGVVDGQATSLSNTVSGAPVATTLINNAAVASNTDLVIGFVARNLGTLQNNSVIGLTGAGSTGVVVGAQGTVNNISTIQVANGTGALVQGATATLTNTGIIEADNGTAAIHLTGPGASVTLSSGGTVIAGGTADGIQLDATDTSGSVKAGATSIAVSGSGAGIDNLGANATIALAGTKIATTGTGDGVSSTGTGATISADAATTINTAGDNAIGLFVSGPGSTVTNSSATVTTAGQNAVGIEMSNGAAATLTAGTVSTTGLAAHGVEATDAGSSIASQGGTVVNTTGVGAFGAYANNGGALSLTDAQISTAGANATGVQADSGTGTQGGTVTVSGGSVTTTNTAADGLMASGAGSTIGASNGLSVTTSGTTAHGVVAQNGAAVTLASAVVNTAGAQADGLVAQNGGSVTDIGSTVSSAAGNGATANSGGVLALTSTTLKGGASGIVTSDTLANGAASTVTVTGGSVASGTGPAFLGNGGTANITVQNGAAVTAGNGTLLNLMNGSNVTFTASGESLTGNIFSDVSSTGNIYLTNDTTLTGYIDPVAMTIDGTSLWNVTSNSMLSSLSNAGTVAFVAPTADPTQASSYKTVTTGSYAGNNGTLALNTYLASDSSPSDRLIINGGSATGTTAIKVNNTGGPGALTIADGIEVVAANNGGSTAASAFHLAGPVQAGAFQYLLYRGGSSSADNWYLRTYLEPVVPPTVPVVPPAVPVVPPTVPVVPVTPVVPPSPPSVAYRPGVVGYSMTPGLNLDYGFSILSKLHERVGDIASAEQQQNGNHDGFWGRIGGQYQDLDANNDRFNAESRTYFMQFGKDWTVSQPATGGSEHVGMTLTLGTSSVGFSDLARSGIQNLSPATGSAKTQAESVGGYWTKYLSDGTYFDTVGQITHYNNSYSDVYGGSASQNGYGVTLSQEIGKPFQLGGGIIAIEPQGQLMYQALKLDGFNDNVSSISGGTTTSLRGRIGVRFFQNNEGNVAHVSGTTPYFTVDVLHDFLSPTDVIVGGTPINSGVGRTWGEVGIGMTKTVGKTGELYGTLKFEESIGGPDRETVSGQVGYRYSW
ncbi:autotransporter outer membrane beta-barrel domain-containing protein [Glaciimonas soli]|uniref:Autotransporter outer membrane beta-barrel domain-containing protein n=1 Tax=Glaciimonas soli TaxID=2590999 RepID=A0A843YVK4_9BURK|nr:autotransporter outer membrane beta-barrel domain-containing protein [Glaciimonas soli]MQR01262.1 autotransporter outer membrane beta-barrel domain-containing protein [Glaciimonas soli]